MSLIILLFGILLFTGSLWVSDRAGASLLLEVAALMGLCVGGAGISLGAALLTLNLILWYFGV